MLTNNIINFEQLEPGYFIITEILKIIFWSGCRNMGWVAQWLVSWVESHWLEVAKSLNISMIHGLSVSWTERCLVTDGGAISEVFIDNPYKQDCTNHKIFETVLHGPQMFGSIKVCTTKTTTGFHNFFFFFSLVQLPLLLFPYFLTNTLVAKS